MHRIKMGTQEDMECTNKGSTSCDWSFGNHYHETQGLLSKNEDSCIF